MGSGKSTIGRILSKKLKKDFLDTDREIVQREKKSIPEIFEQDGEEYFRKLETDLLKELSNKKDLIVSTGGGMMANETNVKIAQKNGFIILLSIPFEECYERIKNSPRPIVKQRSKQGLKELYTKRKDIYSSVANMSVATTQNAYVCVNQIISLLKSRNEI